MDSEYVFTMRGRLGPPIDFGSSLTGHRMYYALTGGTIEGPEIKGEILPGGGDWIKMHGGRRAELDVRLHVRTEDGSLIYIHYPGWMELNEKVLVALSGGPETGYDDLYARATPRMETGSSAYSWVNDTVFICRGRVIAGPTIEVEVFRLT
jgi:hypothetical protein